MTHTARLAARYLSLAIATMLSLTAAGICAAAQADLQAGAQAAAPRSAAATADSPEKIAELEQIWVQGKRIFDRIKDAEDEFFPLYNKLNKKNDFDVRCGYAYLNPESMIMSRACLPGFLGKGYGAPMLSSGSCEGQFYSIPSFGEGYTSGIGTDGGATSGPCVDAGYRPPTSSFIVYAKREEMQKQMLKVVSGDSRLLGMAAHLGDLYKELDSVQHRYREAKGIEDKSGNRDRKPVKSRKGQRSL